MNPEVLGKSPLSKPGFFYGWVMVAVGFVNLGIAFGVWYSFSVFIISIIKEFGWTRAAASSIFSVFIFSQALMNLLAGHLQDRFGPRVVIPIGAVLLSISLILTSQSYKLWHFSLTYGVFAGASVSLMGFASHAAFIPKWFERKRGLAVGIAMSGIGFGMLFLIPLVEKCISQFGWRMTYISLAGLVLLLVVPLNLIFSRRSPESIGLMPDGDDSKAIKNGKHSMIVKVVNEDWAQESWTMKKAIRTKRFWFMAFAFYFIAFSYQGTLLHSVSAMVDFGLKRESAAYFFGILGIMGSVGKITLGYLSDVYGRERVNTLGAILAVAGILSLINVSNAPGIFPFMFAVFFGLGYGAAAPLLPSVCADIFIGKSFGLIFAMIAIGGGLGGATGSYMAGLLHDASGTYIVPFMVFLFTLSASCALIWFASPRKIRIMVKNSHP